MYSNNYQKFCPIIFFNRGVVEARRFNVSGVIKWENKTLEWKVTANLFAVDNGKPRRGDFFPVTITYKPSCDEFGRLAVNETSGEVYFEAPGMTKYNISKMRYGKIFETIALNLDNCNIYNGVNRSP